ncbi:hypothetical protein HGRIS_008944 [Hohenbuehelia grisea]|uniref:Uncharacterized protein n=1 Tax=Hohenbuehelia grisea TaxID=104357 RepID=A0ABR3IZS5_9AGAR
MPGNPVSSAIFVRPKCELMAKQATDDLHVTVQNGLVFSQMRLNEVLSHKYPKDFPQFPPRDRTVPAPDDIYEPEPAEVYGITWATNYYPQFVCLPRLHEKKFCILEPTQYTDDSMPIQRASNGTWALKDSEQKRWSALEQTLATAASVLSGMRPMPLETSSPAKRLWLQEAAQDTQSRRALRGAIPRHIPIPAEHGSIRIWLSPARR